MNQKTTKDATPMVAPPVKVKPKVSICRVLAKSDFLKANALGDRISLDPQKAQWLEKQGVVVVLASNIAPEDILEAGSWDKYVAANPKVMRLSASDLRKLGPIPGMPTEDQRKKPWEFEVVE